MADPAFDDPGPPIPEPASRARRAATIAILLTLIVAMVFLAFISGRGAVRVTPEVSSAPSVVVKAASGSRLAVIDAAGRLVTTDALGGSIEPFGEAGVTYAFPAWSPDGSHIAAIGHRGDEAAIDLFAVGGDVRGRADPTIVYRSTDHPPFYLYWSPDSRGVTFLTQESDRLALRSAPANASASDTVLRQGSPLYWAWAEQDRLLVHSDGEGIGGFVGEVDANGVAVEREAIEPGAFRVPAISTDGRYRAYAAPGDGTAVDGAPDRVIVETRDRASSHAQDVFGTAAVEFGPGTDQLAFVAPLEPGVAVDLPIGPLRIMDASSGRVRTLLAGTILGFFWAPDGRTIAALQLPTPGDEKVASVGRARLAVATGGSTAKPGTAADTGAELRVVFVDVETGTIRSHWSFVVADTFTSQLLPYFDQYALSHRLWSADGTTLALPVVGDDGSNQLMVIRADGSDATRVADGISGFWSP